MEAQLLQEAIAEYEQSLLAITEALQADPADAELAELKEQLESALGDAAAALAGLQPDEPAAPTLNGRSRAAVAVTSADGAGLAAAAEVSTISEAAAANLAATATPAAVAEAPAGAPRSAAAAAAGNNARIHPRSKYAFEAPDFAALAQLYPSLQPHLLRPRGGSGGSREGGPVLASTGGQPTNAGSGTNGSRTGPGSSGSGSGSGSGAGQRQSIDFTSPAACRELTRVLLKHDFGVEWWVPLGQLVPPVTNRANYIHWLEDLLSLSAPKGAVVGLDIGCGANLIYPLLGAVLCGWRFVGADVTPAALEWAARNLSANPQLAGLIELRSVEMQLEQQQYHAANATAAASSHGGNDGGGSSHDRGSGGAAAPQIGQDLAAAQAAAAAAPLAHVVPWTPLTAAAAAPADGPNLVVAAAQPAAVVRLNAAEAAGSGIISSAVREGERLAFCMCNPPFFESLEEAGRNPGTAFGGTAPEMVYPGGEVAFVTAMVQDSLALRGAVHWYTTMVGKKATLKAVRTLLYRHGVRVVRTTELAQGKTSRWALAWSFTADTAAASQPLPRFPAPAAATAGDGSGRGGGRQEASAAGGQRRQQQAAAAGSTGQQQQQAAVGRRQVSRKLSWQVQAPAGAGLALLEALQQCLQQAGLQCKVDQGSYSILGSYMATPAERQEEVAAEGAAAGPPAAKRQRPAGGGGSGGGQQQQRWLLELRLFMQHPGLFLLTVVLPKAAPDGALPWFGQLAQQLQQALSEHWKVLA